MFYYRKTNFKCAIPKDLIEDLTTIEMLDRYGDIVQHFNMLTAMIESKRKRLSKTEIRRIEEVQGLVITYCLITNKPDTAKDLLGRGIFTLSLPIVILEDWLTNINKEGLKLIDFLSENSRTFGIW